MLLHRYIFVAFLLFAPFANLLAQHIYMCKNAAISFFSEARMENIEALSNEGSGALNSSTGEFVVKVRVKSFRFKNGLMEEHFNENYMESDKYPDAIFKGSLVEKIDPTVIGEFKFSAKGTLTVHGIAVERTIDVIALVKEGGIIFTSQFMLPVASHKIDIPNDKITNISQNIDIKINANFLPNVKK